MLTLHVISILNQPDTTNLPGISSSQGSTWTCRNCECKSDEKIPWCITPTNLIWATQCKIALRIQFGWERKQTNKQTNKAVVSYQHWWHAWAIQQLVSIKQSTGFDCSHVALKVPKRSSVISQQNQLRHICW